MRTAIFVGPTLPLDILKSLNPEAEICPPIRFGDLLRLSLEPGDTAVIIDGFYFQVPSVRHKEILSELSRGVRVIGSSSLGAMRAAELHPFGMEGVGRIFRLYTLGLIDGDDEVAVAHGPQETGYGPTCEALVNIRYHTHLARRSDIMSRRAREAILNAAKSLPFFQRTYETIFSLAEDEYKLVPEVRQTFLAQRPRFGDLKQLDAVEAVRLSANGRRKQTTPYRPIYTTTWLQQWIHRFTGRLEEDGLYSDATVMATLQLHVADFPTFLRRVARQVVASWTNPIPKPEAGRLINEFRQSHDILTDGEYHRWLTDHALSPYELGEELVARWALESHPHAATLCADYLAQRGVTIEHIDALISQGWIGLEESSLSSEDVALRIISRSFYCGSELLRIEPILRQIKMDGAYAPAIDLVRKIREFNKGLRSQHPEIEGQRLSRERVKEWFSNKWSATTWKPALLERGFPGDDFFHAAAAHSYLCDKNTALLRDLRLDNGLSPPKVNLGAN